MRGWWCQNIRRTTGSKWLLWQASFFVYFLWPFLRQTLKNLQFDNLFYLLLHNMFRPSGPDHVLINTGHFWYVINKQYFRCLLVYSYEVDLFRLSIEKNLLISRKASHCLFVKDVQGKTKVRYISSHRKHEFFYLRRVLAMIYSEIQGEYLRTSQH